MFRLLAIVGLLCVMARATAADPAVEFEKIVQTGSTTIANATPVYLNSRLKQWAKRRFAVHDVKYDVKRTDSLLNPIVGILTFDLATMQTTLVGTKEEADGATDFDPTKGSTYKVWLTYAYKDDRWQFKDGEYEAQSMRGNKFPFTQKELTEEANRLPFAAVKYWIP